MTWSSGNPNVKSKRPLPGAPNVKVVLRYFHRHCYKGSPVVVRWLEGLRLSTVKM
jgi:hypothetical protein